MHDVKMNLYEKPLGVFFLFLSHFNIVDDNLLNRLFLFRIHMSLCYGPYTCTILRFLIIDCKVALMRLF
jgi:hypothetical protein